MLEDAKRKQITLLCFVLANVIFSTFLVFLDSYSVYIWEYETNVGPATMFMQSQAELPDEAAFMQIEGIEKAALMTKSWASLVAFPPDQNATSLASEAGDISALNGPAEPSINTTVKAIEMNLDLVTDFPTIFNLTEGKWPEEPWECAFAEWLANLFGVELGAIVTYESGFVHEYVQFRLVGIYSHPETDNRNQGYYVLGDTIVMPQYVSDRERTYYAYLKVKNLVLHPNLVSNALATLSEIEEDIRFLDPQYRLFHHTTFTLDDILGKGIQRYLVWISKTGIDQLIRSQVAIFVGIILTALTVRFNVKNQEDRIDLLTSRGASTNQTNILVAREIILLSLGSMLFALPLGLAISRVGLLAQGFFVFSAASIIETPVLVTISTVLMAFAFSLVLPLVVFGSIKLQSRNTKLEGIENVKLAKLVRAIRLIRWDAAVVLISLGLTLGLWEIGSRLNNAPLLYSAIYILPVLMMIGLASLITRGMNFGSLVLSKRLHRILPKMSLEIGARRTGFDSKTSGFTILIFALVCSLAWNGVIVNSSLPHTALAHARFAIGGDVTFRLDTDYHDAFTELKENLSHISGVLSTTLVIVCGFSLSSSLQNTVDFAIIDTDEMFALPYDESGIPIENSHLSVIVQSLSENPTGVVITSDISQTYELVEGDTLRAFKANGTIIDTLSFSVLKIVDYLPDTMVTSVGFHPPQIDASDPSIGRGRIWISNQYEHVLLDDDFATGVFLCARLSDGIDARSVVSTVFDGNPGDIIIGYSTAVEYADELRTESEYTFNGSIDTMLVVATLAAIPGSYLIYIYSGKEDRKRDEVMMRILGAESRNIKITNQIEILILTLYGVFLLLLCMPILIQNSLLVFILQSTVAYSAYPIPILLIIPLFPFFAIFLGTIAVVGLIMLLLGAIEERETLVDCANGIWEETNNFRRSP